MFKPAILAIMILSGVIPSVLHAREVQLLAFVAPTVGGSEARSLELPGDLIAPEEKGLEAALTDGFSALTPSYVAEHLGFSPSASTNQTTSISQAASMVPVPRWMQTGTVSIRGGGSPALAALPLLAATCADAQYRRRLDLPASTEARRARLFPLIARVACEAGVPVGLFDALVGQESRYNRAALSPKGAMGLTQLMPGTARHLKVADPWDPVQNLQGGARYLRAQLAEFGRVDLALAAYNAGPGRVRAGRRIPPFRETIGYVSKITRVWSGRLTRAPAILRLQSPSALQFLNASTSSIAEPALLQSGRAPQSNTPLLGS